MGAHRSFKDLVVKIWNESVEDDLFGTAAELSYYFLLALFPLLIFVTSMIGFLPVAHTELLVDIARVVPQDAMKLVQDTLNDVVSHRSGGLLSFGLIASLWSASSGVASLMSGLNKAYDVVETRSFWKRQMVSLCLTVATVVLIACGSVLIMIGHRLGVWLKAGLGFSTALATVSTILSYAMGFGLLLAGIWALYYFGPAIKRGERPVKPGALIASGGIVIGSLLFSLYLRVAPSASATYGALGAVVTLMLWLYLMGLVLLLGAEINAEVA